MIGRTLRIDARLLSLALLLLGLAVSVQDGDASVLELLPAEDELAGWSIEGQPRLFPADSLWQYIDGAAEQFLNFGCTSLAVAYYTKDQSEIGIEIYGMKDRLGAFGIYQLERPREQASIPLGAQGYQESERLVFFGDVYYVKLQAFPADSSDLEAMQTIGASIARRHLNDAVMPPQLDLLPAEDRIPNSIEFVPSGALGLAGLSRAVAARYGQGGQECALYLVHAGEAHEMDRIFSSTCASLEKRSLAPVAALSIGGAEGVRIVHRYHGTVWVLPAGSYLILIAGVDQEAWTRSFAEGLLANLASHGG